MNGSDAIFDRYLYILGVSKLGPSWQALTELTSAHLIRIPFENLSKIHRAKVLGIRNIPSLEEYLDGIERFHFGGTCFVKNYYLHLLLIYLGYDVKLCGTDVFEDGSPPDGHMVNVVAIAGDEAIVDVGFGAPFWYPIPRDSTTEITLRLGTLRYVPKPKDNEGRNRLEIYRDAQLILRYLLKLTAKKLDDFEEVIARSYANSAPLLNYLLLVRYFRDGAVRLVNHTLTEVHGFESRTQKLATKEEIIGSIEGRFGIPADIVCEAIDALGDTKIFV
jgi:N-hydroxyarylamine O-acetyltransferase